MGMLIKLNAAVSKTHIPYVTYKFCLAHPVFFFGAHILSYYSVIASVSRVDKMLSENVQSTVIRSLAAEFFSLLDPRDARRAERTSLAVCSNMVDIRHSRRIPGNGMKFVRNLRISGVAKSRKAGSRGRKTRRGVIRDLKFNSKHVGR